VLGRRRRAPRTRARARTVTRAGTGAETRARHGAGGAYHEAPRLLHLAAPLGEDRLDHLDLGVFEAEPLDPVRALEADRAVGLELDLLEAGPLFPLQLPQHGGVGLGVEGLHRLLHLLHPGAGRLGVEEWRPAALIPLRSHEASGLLGLRLGELLFDLGD